MRKLENLQAEITQTEHYRFPRRDAAELTKSKKLFVLIRWQSIILWMKVSEPTGL
jgi:hypothetical protein